MFGKRIVAAIARIAYRVFYPVIGVILHNSHRVRAVVICRDQILLQRSYWGTQAWSLPGGGVSRGEGPEAAAVRETLEETGVEISADQLRTIGARRLPSGASWPQVDATFLHAALSRQQAPRVTHHWEIIEAGWFPLDQLPERRSKTVDVGLRFLSKARD